MKNTTRGLLIPGFTLKTRPKIWLTIQVAMTIISAMAAAALSITQNWEAVAASVVSGLGWGISIHFHILMVNKERMFINAIDDNTERGGIKLKMKNKKRGGNDDKPDLADVKKMIPEVIKRIKKKIEEAREQGKELEGGTIEINGIEFGFENALDDDGDHMFGEITGSLTDFSNAASGGSISEDDSIDEIKNKRERMDKAMKDFYKDLGIDKDKNGE